MKRTYIVMTSKSRPNYLKTKARSTKTEKSTPNSIKCKTNIGLQCNGGFAKSSVNNKYYKEVWQHLLEAVGLNDRNCGNSNR